MLINIIVPATNTSNALTLKINDGESKPVGLKTGGVGINSYSLQEGTLQTLYYDGTSWIINHQPNATTLNEGLVKLSSSTSLSSNNLAATPGAVKNVNDSLVALETLVAGKKIHYTSIQTSENPSRKMCKNGFNSGTSCGHTSWEKYGEGNNMSEFYGGIFIPNIEDYSFIVAELNFGGNTAVSTQINGGIVLYTDKIGTPDSIYGEGWREYLLTPPTNNYVKVTQTKLIAVGNRTGEHVIGSVWDTYSGTVNIWGGGFGTTGCTLRVIAFTK